MNKFFSAALAALVMMVGLVSSPAVARDTSRVWNLPTAEAKAQLEVGMRTCFGDAKKNKQSLCSVYDPVNRLMATSLLTRENGVVKNLTGIIISPTDENGNVLRESNGRPIVLAGHVAEQTGGKAILAQGLANIPAAMLNGVGAAAINAAFPACGKNCGGGGSVAYAISGSEANAFLEAALQGGGCATGTCGNAGHSQNGPTPAPKAANDNTIMTPQKAVGQ